MVSYSDYQKILNPVNWVSFPSTGDSRTVVSNVDGAYRLYYTMLNSLAEFNNLGYYLPNGPEAESLPNDTPALLLSQSYIIPNILHTTLDNEYSVTFEDVANVNFNIGNIGDAHITFGQLIFSGAGTLAGTGTIADGPLAYGDIWLNSNFDYNFDGAGDWTQTAVGTIPYMGIMHEIGHALGLDHSDPTNNPNSSSDIDSHKYSIMSYNWLDGMDVRDSNGYPTSDTVAPFGLQLLDIAALQAIYGINWETRADNTTYSKLTAFASTRPNEAFIYTIWDGAGTDEIDASGYTYTPGLPNNPDELGAVIDLREGHFSSLGLNAEGGRAVDNLAVAFKAQIENATGTHYHDHLIGNEHNNVLTGGAGNDTFWGNGGVDTIYGGDGTDTYAIGNNNAVITASAVYENDGTAVLDSVERIGLSPDVQQTLYIASLGHTYVYDGTNPFSATFDYSGYEDGLFFDLSGAEHTVSDATDTDGFDLSGAPTTYAHYIGTIQGDEYFIDDTFNGSLWLGTGDDDVYFDFGFFSNAEFIYSGGSDILWGETAGVQSIRFDPTISHTDITFSESVTNVLDETTDTETGAVLTRNYIYDLLVTIAGKGEIGKYFMAPANDNYERRSARRVAA